MSGMGELHLEVIETKLKDDYKIPITTSEPIVVYKETIENEAKDVEGKSPNRHTKFDVTVMPLEQGVVELIENGTIREGKPKGKQYLEELVKAGMPREEARGRRRRLEHERAHRRDPRSAVPQRGHGASHRRIRGGREATGLSRGRSASG